MSHQQVTWAYRQHPEATAGCSAMAQKAVLVALANYGNTEDETYPGIETLTRDIDAGEGTVKRCLRELAKQGFIIDTRQRKGITGRVIVWRLNRAMVAPLAEGPRKQVVPPAAMDGPETNQATMAPLDEAMVAGLNEATSDDQSGHVTLIESGHGDTPSVEPYEPIGTGAAPAAQRPRDAVWDALVDAIGRGPATPDERGFWNRKVGSMRGALGYVPDHSEDLYRETRLEMRRRIGEFRRSFSWLTLSPGSLNSKFGQCGPRGQGVPIHEFDAVPDEPEPDVLCSDCGREHTSMADFLEAHPEKRPSWKRRAS